MIKVIKTCDECGKDCSNEEEQFWEIRLSYRSVGKYVSSHNNPLEGSVQWCRLCMVKQGLLGNEDERKETPPESKPFDTLLREIIKECVLDVVTD